MLLLLLLLQRASNCADAGTRMHSHWLDECARSRCCACASWSRRSAPTHKTLLCVCVCAVSRTMIFSPVPFRFTELTRYVRLVLLLMLVQTVLNSMRWTAPSRVCRMRARLSSRGESGRTASASTRVLVGATMTSTAERRHTHALWSPNSHWINDTRPYLLSRNLSLSWDTLANLYAILNCVCENTKHTNTKTMCLVRSKITCGNNDPQQQCRPRSVASLHALTNTHSMRSLSMRLCALSRESSLALSLTAPEQQSTRLWPAYMLAALNSYNFTMRFGPGIAAHGSQFETD